MSKLPKSLEQRKNEIANAYANTDPVIDIERACNHGFQACADELLPQIDKSELEIVVLKDALERTRDFYKNLQTQLDAKDTEIAKLKAESADELAWLHEYLIAKTLKVSNE